MPQRAADGVSPCGMLQNLPSALPGVPDVTVCGIDCDAHTQCTVSPTWMVIVEGTKAKALLGPTLTVTLWPVVGAGDGAGEAVGDGDGEAVGAGVGAGDGRTIG